MNLLNSYLNGWLSLYGADEDTPIPTPEEITRMAWDTTAKNLQASVAWFESTHPEVVAKAQKQFADRNARTFR